MIIIRKPTSAEDMAALVSDQLDTLYRTHASWLLDWLTVRAHCRTRASDLVQETFCRLVETPQLRLHSHPRRYLATVARRLLIDESRKRVSERCFLEAFVLLLGEAHAPAPDRVAEAVEHLSLIARLLEALPPKPRRAFLMSRLDGLTYVEIAEELGVSASMVKQYISRAHAHCYVMAYGCPD